MDAKFLNVLMMAMLKCNQPHKAVRLCALSSVREQFPLHSTVQVEYFNEMTANAAKSEGTILVEKARRGTTGALT